MTDPWGSLIGGQRGSEPEHLLSSLRRVLLGEDELDESELSAESGVPHATIRRLWRAMGFPDAEADSRTFSRADTDALRNVKAVVAFRGEQSVLEDARTLSGLFARAADVVASSLIADVERARWPAVPDADAAEVITPGLLEIPILVDYLFRRQLLTELTRQLTANTNALDPLTARPMAVIFADLVGFTNLSERLEDDDLASLVSRFQSVAYELVAKSGGRIVKTLGDEVMVVCEEVETALAVATALASSYAHDDLLPEARVGMAHGAVLAAQGDFFGPTVNLASRLASIAPPGAVVVSDEARLALGEDSPVQLTQFGPRRLKGLGWTTSWVVEPPVPDGDEPTEAALEGFYAALLDDDAEELYERAPCGYLSTNPDGLIIKVNQTFLTWTGYERAELVGRRRFVDLLSGGGKIYHETHFAPMLQTQEIVRGIALDILSAQRRRIPSLVNAVLERDASGAPVVIRVVVFDATERREYERELLRAKQQAEKSEREATLLARTLQQTLIPPSLPAIPGIEIAAIYRPAGRGDLVGGDFYDVFEVADGDWMIVIGDVCGKGAEAAVVTALSRYTIRAAAARQSRPSDVLTTLNEALLIQGDGRFCTVVSARLRRSSGGLTLTLCSGGHPLPLLVRAGTPATEVGRHGRLLGVFDVPSLHDCELALEPGDQLVFFTDGVTEGRSSGDLYGDQRLRAATAGHASAEDLANHILDDVLQFQNGFTADDVAIVALRVP